MEILVESHFDVHTSNFVNDVFLLKDGQKTALITSASAPKTAEVLKQQRIKNPHIQPHFEVRGLKSVKPIWENEND